VEAALKTAVLATGKPGILAFEGGYHGLTLGALATTYREDFRGPFLSRIYQGARFAPFPSAGENWERGVARSLETVHWILREGDRKDEVGAVIIEPIQGRAGVRVPPPGFLHDLAQMTREAGALLIFDEIFTGLGRTGHLFALMEEQVVPDLLCLGKGLGGGLPLSACLGSPSVMNGWPPSRGEAIHTSTFLGNPLACAAGLAFLAELTGGGLVERSRVLGEKLLADLRRALEGIPEVAEVRGRGLFLGIELQNPESGRPLSRAAVRASEEALKLGLLVLPAGEKGHVLELSPPLVISEEQLDWAVPRIGEVIDKAIAPAKGSP
jgi:4-aminobutyrate aminotransferase-like enzyme